VCLDEGKSTSSGPPRRATRTIGCERGWLRPNFIAVRLDETEDRAQQPRNPGNVGSSPCDCKRHSSIGGMQVMADVDVRVIGPSQILEMTRDTTPVQHQQYRFVDPQDGSISQRLTTYTGTVPLEHGAGIDAKDITFEFPLLGLIALPTGGGVMGIFPINDPGLGLRPQFRSAVADVALRSIWVKAHDADFTLSSMRADLFSIALQSPRRTINAVVLSGVVSVKLSHVRDVNYRVSVLERMTENPSAQPPILLGPDWNGNYDLTTDGHVGVIVMPGVAQT
jgi:hypothetical protein